MGVLRVFAQASVLRKHGTELDVVVGDDGGDQRSYDPRQDRGGAGHLGGLPGAEKPSRADDGTEAEHDRAVQIDGMMCCVIQNSPELCGIARKAPPETVARMLIRLRLQTGRCAHRSPQVVLAARVRES